VLLFVVMVTAVYSGFNGELFDADVSEQPHRCQDRARPAAGVSQSVVSGAFDIF